jgi:uncharacterized protein (DUF486 family)
MIETFVPFGIKRGISEKPELITQGRPSGALSSVVFDMPKEKKYTSVILIIIILFTISSIFQTVAWYFNIDGKYAFFFGFSISMIFVFFEYLFMLPANSLGYTVFSIFQLSILIELINWTVFMFYIKYIRKEEVTLKGWIALLIIAIGVVVGYI